MEAMDTSLKAALGRLRRVYAGESVVAVYGSQTVDKPQHLISTIADWWRSQDEKAVVREMLARDDEKVNPGTRLKTDWRGRPILGDEDPASVVTVWVIDPHPSGEFTELVIRSWQEVRDFLGDAADQYLDHLTEEESREGVVIRVRAKDMMLHEYQEIEFAD